MQDQQGRINLLENSVVKDRNFRHRFISTFKRDKLGNATEENHDLIRAGSDSAHGGDCVTDSSLYGANGRRDTSTFETLYGLHPAIVPTIREF